MYSKKILCFMALSFSMLPSFSQNFEANDISDLKSALSVAKTLPSENHSINITGNIQFDSAITEALNLEFLGDSVGVVRDFDLNGYALTFLGADKNVKISNLNIIENLPNSGIVSRNKLLTIEKSTLVGHSGFGKELVRNSDGALVVTESKFLSNYAQNGAGIYFNGTSGTVDGSEFSGNRASYGGAIYVNKGDFNISNSQFNKNKSTAGGGALYVTSDASVVLDNTSFEENTVTVGSSGGAIFNNGNLTIKNGLYFANNEVALGSGGAISNRGTLNIDSARFENNSSKQDGGAIADTGSTVVKNSEFINNSSVEYIGGAIASTKDIEIENCLFDKNSAYSFGGAVAVMQGKASISGSKFTENVSKGSFGGGALINYLSTVDLTGDNLFQNNSSATNGGAISATTNSVTNISGGAKFIGNKADGLGGGIFSQGVININANDAENEILFSGNSDRNGSNAVHLDVYNNTPVGIGEMNINVSNGAKVVFEDNISGVENTSVNIYGTSPIDDKVYFGGGNENLKSNVNLKNISIEFYNGVSGMPEAVINAENTHFNFMNNVITQNKLNLNLIGDENSFSIDVDPANSTSDYFYLSNNRTSLSNIVIRNINLLSDPVNSTTAFDIFDHDRYGTNLSLSEELVNKTVYGAVKKYKWALMPKLTLIELSGFNPNIQRYQSATASAFMNQLLSYDYALNRTDEIYSNLREAKLAQQKLNSYVYAGRGGMYVDQYYEDGSSFWIRPYVNLESFHLSGAVSTVVNQSYGSVFGFDYPMKYAKDDWKLFSTIYGAYIGSSQQYENSSMHQNGGYGGYLLSAYRKNFYSGWTINGGGLGVCSSYASGRDNYAIISAGTALKLAYNIKYKRLIIQPNFMTAYTFLNPFNLVNFQGVDMNQSLVNGLTITPSVRVTYRNETSFEPYIFAGCVIPIMSDIRAKADSTKLEKMTLNAWAQFGAGVRKRVSDRITCFAESVIRTGGRVGWGFMLNVQIKL